MGGGQKFSDDIRKGPPRDVLRELFGDGGAPQTRDPVAAAYNFCEQEHRVPFRAGDGIAPPVGVEVDLSLGDPPLVVRGGQTIGVVAGDIAAAMSGCLAIGYRMSGTITAFDAQSRVGAVTVRGALKEVA